MMKLKWPSLLAGVSLSLAFGGTPAEAALNRVWVSGKGLDQPSCGALVSPCRQINYAITNGIVAAGGEINILDPTGFAPFTIATALSIVNDGVGTASIQQSSPGGNAITITAPANAPIMLRGLSIEGLGVAANGVSFTSGASLDVVNCVIRHFTTAGVNVTTNAAVKFNLIDSLVSDIAASGVKLSPGGALIGSVLRSTLINNGANAFSLDGSAAASSAGVMITVADSNASNNGGAGFAVLSGAGQSLATLVATRSIASGNVGAGFNVGANSVLRLSHSVAAGNAIGVNITGGTAYSLGDNSLSANNSATAGLTADPAQ
ncbi:hypothetical protein [Methylocystis parvus]|uniref:hypothetical protein n=1 Tax=Methylocystis parvus TaxID=134 RepID=UPI003C706ABD